MDFNAARHSCFVAELHILGNRTISLVLCTMHSLCNTSSTGVKLQTDRVRAKPDDFLHSPRKT